jgi:hypothetical protein
MTTSLNKGKPYSQEEIDLILSVIPNGTNLTNLASALGRTTDAIGMIYEIAYNVKLLRDNLDDNNPRNDVFQKIANAKTKLGIFIGYNP